MKVWKVKVRQQTEHHVQSDLDLHCQQKGKSYHIIYSLTELSFCYNSHNSFPNKTFLDSSKLKQFANNNFKFDENGRKFSKQVENTVGKREIARYEQFLLFPKCFQMTCSVDT